MLLLPLGVLGLSYILPMSLLIITLLCIVYLSYRQTIVSYPTGGGSYTVARSNLGASLEAARCHGAPLGNIEVIFTLSTVLLTLFVSPYSVDSYCGTWHEPGVWQWWRMTEGESPCCEAF
ncbi:MAG TPA: hypothetical protein VLQ80_23975 [Candidatus Saccharimonadia bacterium]|nr:hypothetical protein [Candidatus Saccharimonadia bacterium]